MKITKKHGERVLRYEVGEAVEHLLNDSSLHREGELERLGERISNQARFIGELVQELVVSGGVIRPDQLQKLLGYDFMVSSDD